jgi:hypothetical protein
MSCGDKFMEWEVNIKFLKNWRKIPLVWNAIDNLPNMND